MKPITFVLIFFFTTFHSFGQQRNVRKYIDPTGTYRLAIKTTKKNREAYGYSGQIQVRKINFEKILMTFEVNKGAPSYNSGSFVDTLAYIDNKVIFVDLEQDSTCKILFEFEKKGIKVKQEAADFNAGCGFGQAVIADGYYKKISNKIPILREPLTGELVE